MPRLSFIVPVYKPKADIFEKHCRSLEAQALKDWEALFVLDGESDIAKNTIKKVFGNDERVRVHNIPHSGAQVARNTGGGLAKGEFLCFFDSDCAIEPGASQMWVEQFDRHPEAGFIYSGYKFFGDKYAIDSQPYDPWTLRIRNYVSGCFPMRKSLYPGWTEGLKSLQDWDMWLSLLEKAEATGWDVNKLGLFVRGYGFSTSFPDPESISGKGCAPDVWLDRVKAVKMLHNLPDRRVCVSSLQYKHDGMALAKLIDADYQDIPNDKPHNYKTIIQVGYSLGHETEKHAAIFGDRGVKKILFWTGDNISEIWKGVSAEAIDASVTVLNEVAIQYCEDREAKRLLERWGFKVEIMPLPIGKPNIKPMPEENKWAIDMAGRYSPIVSVIAQSLPDITLEMVDSHTKLSEYRGLIHFFPDKTISNSIKRAHLMGRHVISNVQQPFCGFIDDKWSHEKFVVQAVDKIRELNSKEADREACEMYTGSTDKLMAVCA